jgi:hypothetical protein
VSDENPGGGSHYWGKRDCRPDAGVYSGWAVGGGPDGAGLACGANYPDEASSWMVYGPFSLADAAAAMLRFRYWLNSEENWDRLEWLASTDGWDFFGYGHMVSGSSDGWVDGELDFSQVPFLGNLLGEPQVWIAFVFESDFTIPMPEGAYLDDILLQKCVGVSCGAGAYGPRTSGNHAAVFSSIALPPR